MNKIFLLLLIFSLTAVMPSCRIFNKGEYTEVVKPRKRSKPYNAKKNRYSKRTKKSYKKLGY